MRRHQQATRESTVRFRETVFARYLRELGLNADRWKYRPEVFDRDRSALWHPWPVAQVHLCGSEPGLPAGFRQACGYAYPQWAWAVKQTLGEDSECKLRVARALRRRTPASLDNLAAVFDLGGGEALAAHLHTFPTLQDIPL